MPVEARQLDEYWETYYTDYYLLLAVDHPQGSNLFLEDFQLP